MLGLFLTFLKLGAFVFGSGHALAGAMQGEIVDRQKWMTAEDFQNGWAAGNVLPGPIATKVVAYVGYEQRGVAGAILATVAYLVPSMGGMVVVAYVLTAYVRSPFVKSLLQGIKPAVLALLVEAFLSFTGVVVPKATSLAPHSLAFALVVAGVAMSVAGMAWIGAETGTLSKFVLGDARSVVIFALALTALLVFRADAVLVTLGAAALGLTYLVF
jgi:chromate transporter